MGRGSMEKSTDMGWQCQHEGITVPTAMQTGAPRPEWLGRGCNRMRSMHCRMTGEVIFPRRRIALVGNIP